MKKYTFTGEEIQAYGRTLKQIQRISDGEIGGYIESESNLSHSGNAWVFGDAKVSDNARVSDNAKVYGDARISGNAEVSGDARVSGNAWVSGNAEVYGNAEVFDNAWVFSKAWVSGNARVSDNARVFGDARVSDNARVFGDAESSTRCLNLNYLPYNITMTDFHVQIGCMQMLAYEWLHVGIDDAVEMGISREDYPKYKALLEVLIPTHFEVEL